MGEFKGTKGPWVMKKNNAYIEIKGEGEINSSSHPISIAAIEAIKKALGETK